MDKIKSKNIELSIRTKLSLSYAFIALVVILVICIVTNIIFEKAFIDYVKKQQEKANFEIVSYIEDEIEESNHFGKSSYQYLANSALNNGKMITMYDNAGYVLYDIQNENSSGCHNMMDRVSHNMETLFPKINGEFVEEYYDINVGMDKIGTISIASYGPFYFDDNEALLMENANRVFFGVGLASSLLALIIGFLSTNKLSNSLTKVIKTTNQIAKGNSPKIITEKTTTKEINSLIDSVNILNSTLEEQKMLRKRLTSDLAHELRTPIANLQGNLEMILEGVWEPDNKRIVSCHEEVIRLGNMINELELLNKIEQEKQNLNKTNFNIKELISGIIIFSEAKAEEKNIKINHDLDDLEMFADKEKITQVITNVISNGIKYTKENGFINIKLESQNENIIIQIEDTGMGISEEDLPHIFERLYRTEQSRNRMTGGMGIGLAITKAIIDEHKGDIKVSSTLGKGTLFYITLPK